MNDMLNKKKAGYRELEWSDELKKRFWDYWDFESQNEELFFTYALGDYLIEKFSCYFNGARNALDLGSGRGYLISPLIKKNIQVSTIEFSDRSIKHLQEQFGEDKGFIDSYSIDEYRKIKNKFDLVFLTEVIEHLSDQELAEDFRIIRGITTSGSRLFITTPHDEVLKDSRVYCPNCGATFHRWQHVRSWDKEGLKSLLASQGFKVVMLAEADLNHEKARKTFNWRQKLADRLTAPDRRHTYKPHLVCVAERE